MKVFFRDIGVSISVNQLESFLHSETRSRIPFLNPLKALLNPIIFLTLVIPRALAIHKAQKGLIVNHLQSRRVHILEQQFLIIGVERQQVVQVLVPFVEGYEAVFVRV